MMECTHMGQKEKFSVVSKNNKVLYNKANKRNVPFLGMLHSIAWKWHSLLMIISF